jgi:hypothetical protein
MKGPGRPRTSALSRAEQLRAAKRAQRLRERDAGLAPVQLRLPEARAQQLQVAAGVVDFDSALARLLDDLAVDLDAWPVLRDLAWNRANRYIAAPEALALYERNWRHVDAGRMGAEEHRLLERLTQRYGAGVFNG